MISQEPWSKDTYYQGYKKSFEQGEYNLSETVRTPTGQVIRRYVSGGVFGLAAGATGGHQNAADSSIVRPANSELLKYTSGGETVAVAAASALTLEEAMEIVRHKIDGAGLNFEYLNLSFPVKEERWEKEPHKELLIYRLAEGIKFGNMKHNLRLVTVKDKKKRAFWGIFLSEMQEDKMELHYVINKSFPGKLELIKTNREITASRQSLENVLDVIIAVLEDKENLEDRRNMISTLLSDVLNYPSGIISMYTEALAYKNAKTYQMRQLDFDSIGALIDEKVEKGAKKYYDSSGDAFYYIGKMAVDNEKELFYEIRVMDESFVDYPNSDERSLYKKIKLAPMEKELESLEIRVYGNGDKKVLMPNTIDNQLESGKLNGLTSRGNAEDFMVRLYMGLGFITASSALTLDEAKKASISMIPDIESTVPYIARIASAKDFETVYDELGAFLQDKKQVKSLNIKEKLIRSQNRLKLGILGDELKRQGITAGNIELNLSAGHLNDRDGSHFEYSYLINNVKLGSNKSPLNFTMKLIPVGTEINKALNGYSITMKRKFSNNQEQFYAAIGVPRDGKRAIVVNEMSLDVLEMSVDDLKSLAEAMSRGLGISGASSALTLETLLEAFKLLNRKIRNHSWLADYFENLYFFISTDNYLNNFPNQFALLDELGKATDGLHKRISEIIVSAPEKKKELLEELLNETERLNKLLTILRQLYWLYFTKSTMSDFFVKANMSTEPSYEGDVEWRKLKKSWKRFNGINYYLYVREILGNRNNLIGYKIKMEDDLDPNHKKLIVVDVKYDGLPLFSLSPDFEKYILEKPESGEMEAVIKEIKEALVSSSPAIVNVSEEGLGAVDFRAMDMLIQPVGSFSGLDFSPVALSISDLEAMNLDKIFGGIKQMTSQDMRPSPQRLKEYVSACIFKGKIDEKADEFVLSMLDVFQLQAEEGIESAALEREAVVMADTRSYVLPEKGGRG